MSKTWKLTLLAFCAVAALLLAQPAAAGEIDGTWNLVIDTGDGIREFPVVIESSGDGVVATIGEDKIKGSFADAVLKLVGSVYSPPEGYSAEMKLTGKLDGGKLAGDILWDVYQVTFTATKAD